MLGTEWKILDNFPLHLGKFIRKAHIFSLSHTVWQRGCQADEMAFRQQSLMLALASRTELLRIVSIAVRCTVQCAAIVAAPGSALLVLPAVWKYINQLLSNE